MNKISSADFAKMEMLLGQIPDEKVAYVGDQVMNAIDQVARAAELLPCSPMDGRDTAKVMGKFKCSFSVGDEVLISGESDKFVVIHVDDDLMEIKRKRFVDAISAKKIKPTANRPYYQRGRW